MDKSVIYLDYMATTPVDPTVAADMMHYLTMDGIFANAASITHPYGKAAAAAIDQARNDLAQAVGAEAREIIFTSGATEADNLAILGAARFYQSKGKHLITMTTEHKAVLDSFHHLEKEGFQVTYLDPQADGLLDLKLLTEAIRPDTILVSIMQVNNETGVIQDIAAIGQLLAKKGIIFHVDAAQSGGKLALNLSQLNVDLVSLSAHKNYGPKGVGALYIRRKPRIRLLPQSFGGGHENGLRSGTLATHQIVGMASAFKLSEGLRVEEQARILQLRERLWQGISALPGVTLNGHKQQRVAGNLNITFAGIEGDNLLYALRELAVSSTSACVASSMQPSYVLKSMGLDNDQGLSSIRLSLGRFTTAEDVKRAIRVINREITRLREMFRD